MFLISFRDGHKNADIKKAKRILWEEKLKVEAEKQEDAKKDAVIRERMVLKKFAEKTVIPGTIYFIF